jgi:hypothetical protein
MRREDIIEKAMKYGVLARTGKELSQSGGVEKSETPTFCE